MNKRLLRYSLLLLAALLLSAPASWAKSKGYCYVVGYSFSMKKAYFSPLIIQKVNSKSYSDEEYVTDMDLIREMESQFKSYLSSLANLDITQFTISARGAFKSNAIADAKYKDEMQRYEARQFTVMTLNDFKFSD